MHRELTIASDVPAPKLIKAFKTGKLSLTASQLKGSGALIHLPPASHDKALKARNAGRGVRLDITRYEIKKGYKRAQGGSIFSKVWGTIKKGFKFAKDAGILSSIADAAVPALATALGAPQGAVPARAALKSLIGVGLYDSDSGNEGGRISMSGIKTGAKRALAYTKRKVILTDAVDQGEKYLLSKATKPEHENLIKSIRVADMELVLANRRARNLLRDPKKPAITWRSSVLCVRILRPVGVSSCLGDLSLPPVGVSSCKFSLKKNGV